MSHQMNQQSTMNKVEQDNTKRSAAAVQEIAPVPADLLEWLPAAYISSVEARLANTQHHRDVTQQYVPSTCDNEIAMAGLTAENRKIVTTFTSNKEPQISLNEYCQRLQRYLRASPEAWVLSLEYLRRVCEVPEEWINQQQQKALEQQMAQLGVQSPVNGPAGAGLGLESIVAGAAAASVQKLEQHNAQIAATFGSDANMVGVNTFESDSRMGSSSTCSTMMGTMGTGTMTFCNPDVARAVSSDGSTACSSPASSAQSSPVFGACESSDAESCRSASTCSVPVHMLPRHKQPKQAMPKIPFTEHTAHKLVFTSLVLAAKQQDDFFLTNKYYGQCGGVDLKSMNTMEFAFLRMLDWKSHVTFETYDAMLTDLKVTAGFCVPLAAMGQLCGMPMHAIQEEPANVHVEELKPAGTQVFHAQGQSEKHPQQFNQYAAVNAAVNAWNCAA